MNFHSFLCSQSALRLVAFRQIHEVLGMEPLPASKAAARNRKRRRDGSDSGEGEGEGKKDKKEEEEEEEAWPLHGRRWASLRDLVECYNKASFILETILTCI